MVSMYMKLWYCFRKVAQKLEWVRVVREYVGPCMGFAILASYCALVPLMDDTATRYLLHQGIESFHLIGISTKSVVMEDKDVLNNVESVLDTLFTNYSLYWGTILGIPTLRQIRAKHIKCKVNYAPDSSCQTAHITSDQVNKTCFGCWKTLLISPHNCSLSDTESNKSVETPCPMGKCESGFGYCNLLSAAAKVGYRVYPSGGHGLHMNMDRNNTWKITLTRLRALHWLDRHSLFVSFSMTALSNVHICRLQLHFIRIGNNSWTFFNETSVEKIQNYFPHLYKYKWSKNVTYTCDKIHRTIASWSVYHDEAQTTEYFLLVLPILTLLLVLVETPHCGMLCKGRAATRLEHMLLVINVMCFVLHLALCITLHLAWLHVIKNVCDPFTFSQPIVLPWVTRMLLLCLILLWWAKLFFHPILLHRAVSIVTEVRQGTCAVMWVLVYLLVVMVVVAVTLRLVRHPATASFVDSFITVTQESIEQTWLKEAWPSIIVFRLLLLLLMFAMIVATVWTVAYAPITSHTNSLSQ
ncbi:uncharacterized protein [Procambarus clarkii]|uniref:uncharacterized protein n=1 Tax=Procambarus clarkii TaxID=6728 RepID=UPI003743578F